MSPQMADVPNVIRLDMGFSINGNPGGTRTFWHYTGTAPTQAQMSGILPQVKTAITTNFIPLWPPQVTLNLVRLTDLSTHSGNLAQDLGTVNGSRTLILYSNANCVLINFQISTRYRGGKPRAYLPGGNTSDAANSKTWTNSYVTAWTTAWLNLMSAMVATTGGPNIDYQACVHWFKGATPNTSTSIWAPKDVPARLTTPVVERINAPLVSSLYGQQRRRLRPS